MLNSNEVLVGSDGVFCGDFELYSVAAIRSLNNLAPQIFIKFLSGIQIILYIWYEIVKCW